MFGLGNIAFEGRNKKYGAYVLRQEYHRNLLWGFVFGHLIVVVPILFLYFYNIFESLNENTIPTLKVDQVVELANLPFINSSETPPPEAKKKQIAETPPEIDKKETPLDPEKSVGRLAENEIKPAIDSSDLPSSERVKTHDTVFSASDVEKIPEFIGGESEFRRFWVRTFTFPNITQKVRGKVFVEFTVSHEGLIGNIKVSNSLSAEVDSEIRRVLQSCPPWKPAFRRGKAVNITMGFLLTLKN